MKSGRKMRETDSDAGLDGRGGSSLYSSLNSPSSGHGNDCSGSERRGLDSKRGREEKSIGGRNEIWEEERTHVGTISSLDDRLVDRIED